VLRLGRPGAHGGRVANLETLDATAQIMKQQCCFCGETIRGEKPATITIELDDGGTQVLHAHVSCLQHRLHKSVPRLPPEEE
jgi:hypothetical protein